MLHERNFISNVLDFCPVSFGAGTASNNNTEEKDEYLRQIVRYVNPSILTVNELCVEGEYQQRILDAVLNDGWIGYYRRAGIQNQAGSDMVNQLYYDSRKLVFHSHRVVQSYVRDIDLFTLYYYSNDLSQGDTAFLHCIVAHLKAGNDLDDERKRDIMTENVMEYLQGTGEPANRLFLGDLNFYRSSEPGFQNLVGAMDINVRFFDPLNQPGNWHNDLSFAQVHTQSTRTEEPGCGASGGMDDRFDFILVSNAVKEGQFAISYMEESYGALGQDGKHFNLSLNEPPANPSVPQYILEALYHTSDHLPVVMKLQVDKTIGMAEHPVSGIKLVNPVGEHATIMNLPLRGNDLSYRWIDGMGRPAGNGIIQHGHHARIPSPANKGFFILQVFSGNHLITAIKAARI